MVYEENKNSFLVTLVTVGIATVVASVIVWYILI